MSVHFVMKSALGEGRLFCFAVCPRFTRGGKAMLQIKNISISMKKDLRELVRDFTFSLNAGDKAAVIGEEGNGKSTLLKLIYDESLIESYAEWSGEVQKSGLILAYLSQEMSEREKELTAYEFSCENEAFLDSSPGDIAAVAGKMKIPVELLYSERKMSTFSGGEKIKLRMAGLMLKKPDVYLLDEPSNDIDIETLEWMESFIKGSSTPVLFISHDETLIENTANVIIHMELLRKKRVPRYTIARMGYEQYISERMSKFEHQEQVATNERLEKKKQDAKLQRIQQSVEHDLRSVSRQEPGKGRLLKKKMKAVKSMEHRFDREAENMTEFPESEEAILVGFSEDVTLPAGKTVLDFQLDKLEAGGKLLSTDMKLNIRGAEHVCIIGRNGAGKTTLLHEISASLLPRTDIKAAYMPQDYAESIDMSMTPVEYLAKSSEKEEITRVKTHLGSMKYTAEEFSHSISELSGGQKAKLFFLKMILDENNVLILDEPTRNFSPLSNPVIREILRNFGGAIISVSHDRKYIAEVCERVLSLGENGLSPVEIEGKE